MSCQSRPFYHLSCNLHATKKGAALVTLQQCSERIIIGSCSWNACREYDRRRHVTPGDLREIVTSTRIARYEITIIIIMISFAVHYSPRLNPHPPFSIM